MPLPEKWSPLFLRIKLLSDYRNDIQAGGGGGGGAYGLIIKVPPSSRNTNDVL